MSKFRKLLPGKEPDTVLHLQVSCVAKSLVRSYILFLLSVSLLLSVAVMGQSTDTTDTPANDSFFLLKSKGLLGRLAQSITTDTVERNVVRIDLLYQRYRGRTIRNITVRSVDFGVPINDTTRSFKNTLTNWADALHRTTRERVIRNNLFFQEQDTLLPILLADNERHLRDQPYLNDVKILVKPVLGTRDSVDIVVLTKDVLSIGGTLKIGSLNRVETSLREDNFGGYGNKLQASVLYDRERARKMGYGAEYLLRNIGGSFVRAQLGFLEYAPSFNTFHRQEQTLYARMEKPLVNPYMKWTWSVEAATHRNDNMYFPDSIFLNDQQYRYYNVDAWIGFNQQAIKNPSELNDDRLRTLIGVRFLHNHFQRVPLKYENEYFYQYANLTGVLGSISLFRQDFYKTSYVYGFGRSEDVPEGLDFSVVTGWTNKNRRVRPYMGLDFQLNYFTTRESYFNYTLRIGGYSYRKRYEDISLLGNIEYFSSLQPMGRKWKQRTFVMASIGTQFRRELNEPLLMESPYGLQEFENIMLGGDHRLTVKAESVFFTDWSLYSFRFAPFVFANGTLLTPQGEPVFKTRMYQTIGGGIRTRNESLVFGTIELRGFYFPGKNFNGDLFRIEFNTNIKFKYNSQRVNKPQFISLN